MSPPVHPPRFPVLQLLPFFGSILFSVLYLIATLYYPGGHYLDKTYKGFSWSQNYWCNLLNENAINGAPNTARPIAFAAMFVLCLTLVFFWYYFPIIAGFKKKARYTIQASGFAAMITCVFIFTGMHDAIINIGGFFGLIALAGTLTGLHKLGWNRLLYMGVFIILLIALNNLMYYGHDMMYYLPVVQKFTFLFFLVWVCLINIRWHRKEVHNGTQRFCTE